MGLFVLLVLLLSGEYMDRPALIPGREVRLPPGKHLLRYTALAEAKLVVEARAESGASVRISARLACGQQLGPADDSEGRQTRIEFAAAPFELVLVEADVRSTDPEARAVLVITETPEFGRERVQRSTPAAESSPELEQALARARQAYREGQALAASDPTGCRDRLVQAERILEQAPGIENSEAGAKLRFAIAYQAQITGNLELAIQTKERALKSLEHSRPALDVDLQRGRVNHSIVLRDLGRVDEALDHGLRAVLILERQLPASDITLLWSRMNLATTIGEEGRWDQAVRMLRIVLPAIDKFVQQGKLNGSLAEDSWPASVLLGARTNLAKALMESGDFPGGLVLFEQVFEEKQRLLPPDHLSLQQAKLNLAQARIGLGDWQGGRALMAEAVGVYERLLPEQNPTLAVVRMGLANILGHEGLHEEALLLKQQAVAALAQTYPEQHPTLIDARSNLASTLSSLERHEEALELFEQVLQTQIDRFSRDHPPTLLTQVRLGRALARAGRLEEAWQEVTQGMDGLLEVLPADHFWVLSGVNTWAQLAARRNDPRLDQILNFGVFGLTRLLRSSPLGAPRELAAIAQSQEGLLSTLLSLSRDRPARSSLHTRLFELIETQRTIASIGGRPLNAAADDLQAARLQREVVAAREELNDLVSSLLNEPDANVSKQAIRAAQDRRDLGERALWDLQIARGWRPPRIELELLAGGLDRESAVVTFRRYVLRTPHADDHHWDFEDHLLAHVVLPDGTLHRIELGPMAPIEQAVAGWRRAIELEVAPADLREPSVTPARRRPTSDTAGAQGERRVGTRLRELVLDPVLARTAGARSLIVCLDDVLTLVPFDALPLDGDRRVGDRYRILRRISLVAHSRSAPRKNREPSLLALGGIDYDADMAQTPESGALPELQHNSSAPPIPRKLEEQEPMFPALAAAAGEALEIAALFEQSFARKAVTLTGRQATKREFWNQAPSARFVHIASHGYFADQSIGPVGESRAARNSEELFSPEASVRNLAPMTLCGLAFAGANRGADSLGRVPGILTAEELCAVDLGQAELVVLSACHTSAGLRRAGQGVLSLQGALHAAGARSSIASLWKVEDRTARRLMEQFYRALWERKMTKHAALWEAKRMLRDSGAPLLAWAGWVLTGEPD